MPNWRVDSRKSLLTLAWLAAYTLSCLLSPAARAQPVVDYGGQTPCSVWLSNPTAMRQGLAWLYGAWSGLNMAGGMKHDVYDVGHTLKAEEVAGAVERVCRQDMTKIMNVAVLDVYVATRVAKR